MENKTYSQQIAEISTKLSLSDIWTVWAASSLVVRSSTPRLFVMR